MTTEKIVTYTAEQTADVLAQYAAGATPEVIAASIGKTKGSVIAKLAREGVYVSPKATTSATKRVTKAGMIAQIAGAFGLLPAQLDTLEKASVPQLTELTVRVMDMVATLKALVKDAGEDPNASDM